MFKKYYFEKIHYKLQKNICRIIFCTYSADIKFKDTFKNVCLANLLCLKWAVQELKNIKILNFVEFGLKLAPGKFSHKNIEIRTKIRVNYFALSKNTMLKIGQKIIP